jgi:hypothetical protein
MKPVSQRVGGALIAVLAGFGMTAAAGGGTGWTVTQLRGTGPTPAESSPEGVSCPSASSCLAVGYYTAGVNTKQPLAESWNGSVWSAQAPAVPAGASDTYLLAVSCPAPSSCQAVGHYDDDVTGPEALVDSWNGSRWTAATPPVPAGSINTVLAGISCTAVTSCEAVGYYVNAGSAFEPLIESDRQGTWTATTPPLPRGSAEGLLQGVSCPAATSCEAVGQYFDAAGAMLAFAESWNGSRWKPSVTPVPHGAPSVLYGVSCLPQGGCWASGVYNSGGGTRALAESWNGSAWTAHTLPTPKGERVPVLFGISCRSASACQAVGGDTNRAGGGEPVVETLRGSVWTATTPPVPASVTNPALAAVSCPSASLCQAVGAYTTASDAQEALDETWRGTSWSDSTWPGLPGPPDATVSGVACTSRLCAAAGYIIDPEGGYQALTEIRQGGMWARITPPTPSGGSAPVLAAVSCGAPDSCLAVGAFNSSGAVHFPLPLAEAWNGTRWTAATPPLPAGATQGGLDAVSCDGAGYCQAVGYYYDSNEDLQSLAETWNGTRWAAATPPVPAGGKDPELAAVSCPAASSCMAGGQYTGTAGAIVPLAEELRNGRWTAGSPPSPARADAAYVYAVSCVSVSRCEAAGEYEPHAGGGRPLAEAWQSGAWTAQTPPAPAGAAGAALTGISCRAAGCLAVGQYQVARDAVPPDRPLADSLRGRAWTLSRVPLPRGAAGAALSAVTCGTADCVSAGADTTPAGGAYPIVADHRTVNLAHTPGVS